MINSAASRTISPEPRFYFIGINYLQSIEFIQNLVKVVYDDATDKHQNLIASYWENAYNAIQLSMENDDISAVPTELKEGGMHLLMAKLHFRFGNGEAGKTNLRYARNYADNGLNDRQWNSAAFVNTVDDLYKQYMVENQTEQAGAAQRL